MSIPQIAPKEAQQILTEEPNALYLDVRSVPEFSAGHAVGAINIPLLHSDPATGRMTPNPDFERVAQAVLPRDKKLVVGCKMGGRSQRACEQLAQLGYSDVSNIAGGFVGTPEQPGWSRLGLPISTETGEGVGYESLVIRIK